MISLFFIFGSCKDESLVVKELPQDSLNLYMHYAKGESKMSLTQRILANKKALWILSKGNNDSVNRKKINDVSWNFFRMNEWDNFKEATLILKSRSEKENDIINVANAYRFLGIYFESISVNDSAFNYYLKAEKIFKQNKKDKELCVLYCDMAQLQYYFNDYLGSETKLIRALKIAKKYNLKKDEFAIYNFLGINSNELHDYDKALEYYIKALELFKYKQNTSKSLVNCLNDIGYNFVAQNKINQGIKFYKLGLKSCRRKEYPFMYARLYDNLANAKLKIGDFSGVLNLLQEAWTIRDTLHIDQGQNFNRYYLSEYYAAVKDTSNAKKYAIEAYDLSQSYKAPSDMMMCLKHLSKIDPKNALKYSVEYIKISDSIHQQERETRNKFAKIAYETEEITQEKDLAEKQKSIFMGWAIAVTAFGLLLFLIVTQRIRQKELVYTQNQQKAKEEIYQLIQIQQSKIDEGRLIEKKRIARDLHDGIMNKLASTRFNLHILNIKKDKETVEKCIPYIDGLQDIEKEIRDIAHDLNAGAFSEKDSYKKILMTFFEDQKNILLPKLHTDIDKSIKWKSVESIIKINIYRILQEALQNIAKHANAENIFVNITNKKKYLTLEIHDDGKGFSTTNTQSGIGLQNIQIRAKECRAIFHVNSDINNGTTIIVSVPLIQ